MNELLYNFRYSKGIFSLSHYSGGQFASVSTLHGLQTMYCASLCRFRVVVFVVAFFCAFECAARCLLYIDMLASRFSFSVNRQTRNENEMTAHKNMDINMLKEH